MQLIDPYVGTYFSKQWIRKKVLHLNEEEMEQIDTEIEQEAADQETSPQPYGMPQQQPQQPMNINQAFGAAVAANTATGTEKTK
jgi:hypothetical protein